LCWALVTRLKWGEYCVTFLNFINYHLRFNGYFTHVYKMARLLDLPDELLEAIVAEGLSFQDELSTPLQPCQPFTYIAWAKRATQAAEVIAQTNYLLRQLILTCRRLYNLLQPMLYRQINTIRSAPLLNRFVRTFESSHALASNINSVTTFDVSLAGAMPLFYLPSITSVKLIRAHVRGYQGVRDGAPNHMSPVESISLIACGATDEKLSELFKWPRSLKSLAYEINQSVLAAESSTLDLSRKYNCNTFVQALFHHRSSLEKLTFTRTEGCRRICDVPLNLSKFTALKTLSTTHAFLISGSVHERSIPRRLPPSLEELQIYYDEADRGGWCAMGAGFRHWLVPLLRQKTGRLPRLRKVDLITPEAISSGRPYLRFVSSNWAQTELQAVRAEIPQDMNLVVS